MEFEPFVSVIIPVYNGAAFLADAVESIRRQDYRFLEIIIVDDGSTDETASLAQRFGGDVRYVYQSNQGPGAARNQGLKIARGEVLGFLDSDDLWSANKLELQIAHLAQDPAVDIVLSHTQLMLLTETADGTRQFKAALAPWFALLFGSALFRRRVFDRVGLLDESMRHGEDVDWFLRAREQGIAMSILNERTLFYRIHEHNMTHDIAARDVHFIKALKKSLDRRRQEGGGPVTPLPDVPGIDALSGGLMDGI